MSRHRSVRNLDVEKVFDEYDDVEEDIVAEGNEADQLTPEDEEAMARGTEAVQTALGSDTEKITVPQIQEALWHYFYDVEQSVAYLRRRYIAPPPKPEPKKAKALSGAEVERSVEGSGLWETDTFTKKGFEEGFIPTQYPAPRVPQPPCSWYFHDMPWLQIPRDRETLFIIPPQPRGGLLGGGEGTPKQSKLQAIAAARKKKAEAQKPDDKVERAEKRLSHLALNDQASKENAKPGSVLLTKRQKLSGESSQNQPSETRLHSRDHNLSDTNRKTIQTHRSPSAALEDTTMDLDDPKDETIKLPEDDCVVLPYTKPSAFAQTLFGSASEPAKSPTVQTYALPYMASSTFVPSAFSEPSPDDIVLTAQAKAGNKFDAAVSKTTTAVKKAGPSTKKGKGSNGDVPTGDLKGLQIDDTPAPKSKRLDVAREFAEKQDKRSASFVVVGHVDAGKSTLMGRLLLELRYVEEHTVDRYRRQGEKIGKASFALAWVMDQREEERERGITIDIATNQFETERTRFTILDAPGHKDFVPNMIAGASQADFAILVIDGNTGAFEKGLKGQTREHALLLRSLGVQRVIVAVNKLDMVGWSQARFDEITAQVTGFMKGNGFQLSNVTFIPISGLNGDNLVRKSEDPAISWYSGITLIEALEASEPNARALEKPFRMSISEIYRSQQSQMTVSGRIDSGTVQAGDALIVQPSGETASIRSIEVDSEVQDWAVAGQNVSIGLSGIDSIHVRVGDIISHKATPIECSSILTMKVLAFEHLMPMPVDVHRGRLHAAGRIQTITATLDKTSGAVVKRNPKIVQPANVARVVVQLESKVPLEAGQRVVLRNGGETIAAGLLE